MEGPRGEYRSWRWGRDVGWEGEGERGGARGSIARKWPNEETVTGSHLLLAADWLEERPRGLERFSELHKKEKDLSDEQNSKKVGLEGFQRFEEVPRRIASGGGSKR